MRHKICKYGKICFAFRPRTFGCLSCWVHGGWRAFLPKIFGIGRKIYLRQEVLLRVLNGVRTTYRETGRLLPWVMTITVNVVNDYYRQHAKEAEIILEELPPSLMLSEDFSDDWDYWRRYEHAYRILEQVYKDLPLEDRTLIYSLFYENQSFRQVALSRGVSKSSCFKYLQRLLFRLRKMMIASGVDRSFLEER